MRHGSAGQVFTEGATQDARAAGPGAVDKLQRVRNTVRQALYPAMSAAGSRQPPPTPPGQQAAPPPVVNQAQEEAWDRLAAAEEGYAEQVARERSTSVRALLDGRTTSAQIRQRLLRPVAYHQAMRLRADIDRTSRDYAVAQDAYLATFPDPGEQVREKFSAMENLEQRVLELQVGQTRSAVDAQGNAVQSRLDRTRTWMAGLWLRGGTATRAATVILPAAVVGLGAGVTMAYVERPLLSTAVGIGALVVGRLFGSGTANTVNWYKPAVAQERDRLEAASAERIRQSREAYNVWLGQTAGNHDPAQINAVGVHQAGSSAEVQRNYYWLRFGERTGMIAAGLCYAAGHIITSSLLALAGAAQRNTEYGQATQTVSSHPSPTATATQGAPAPTPAPIPPQPANLTTEYPWDAVVQYNTAHHLPTTPGGIWATLRHMAQLYNQTHPGARYEYVLQPNGTYWLEDDGQPLSWSQTGAFNTFLWGR